MAGGTVLGQGLLFLVSPILTRLYTPEDFGILAVYSSILATLSVMVAARYEVAIPLPDDDADAAGLTVLALLIVAVVSGACGLVVQFAPDPFVRLVGRPTVAPFLWFLPLSLLGVGTYQVLNYWAVRFGAFDKIARTKLMQSLGQAVGQIGLSFLNGPLGLLAGDVIGRVGGSGTLSILAWRTSGGLFRRVRMKDVWRVLVRYRRFPLILLWSSLINNLSAQVPVLMLASTYGDSVVGMYSLSNRVLHIPMMLIGNAVAQVFYSNVAEAKRSGRTGAVTLSAFRLLVRVGMPAALLLAIGAPELFSVVFGAQWRMAGSFSLWLMPWLLLVFITTPLGAIPLVYERQQGELIFQVVLFGGRVIALLVGRRLGDASVAIGVFAGVSMALWLSYLFWIMRLAGVSLSAVCRDMVAQFLTAILCVVPVLLAKAFHLGDSAVVLATLFSSGICAVWVVRLGLREEN